MDNAKHTMLSVVTNPFFDWSNDRPPRRAYHETVIYEAHVKGLTRTHPALPEAIRGTYAGIGHPAIVEHLTSLGVTAIELMPVHQFAQDGHLQQPADAAPARAAADHGLAALLGARDARRRVPVRSGRHPGTPVPRGGPAVGVLRPGPAGPGGQPGEADRGAVGRRRRRLPGGE